MNNPIILKKVTVHNLKGVDLTIEPGQLVVFTGVSGSGKSSLAFDTIYVEGQRRYIESLPAKPGHMVKLAKPEAEKISGIAPTIAIEQKLAARTPRSTVGTLTGIYDFLRVLFAKLSTPYCPISKEPVSTQAREKIIRQIQKLPEGKRMILLAPYAKGKKGEFIDDFKELLSKGFTRLRVDGEWVDLTEEVRLDGKVAHNIEIVIDRCKIEEEAASRIAESVQLALEMGKGVCITHLVETKEEEIFSEIAFSAKSGLSYPPLFPHDFSFNHPIGMCPTCQGLKVISTEEKKEKGCPVCKGAGIKPYPAAARLGGKTIQEITNLPLDQLLFFFQNLPLTPLEKEIGEELIKEIEEELHFLLHVGLSYLSLDRISPSLSGGESQRVRLAAQIGAGLVGAIYILDEPSIGLHASDHHRLIETLFHLRDQGNTVLVVEHDVDTMRAADLIVDVGPGAGKEGGEILTVGKIEEVMKNPRSLTGQYLSGKKKIEIPKKRRKPTSFLKIVGAEHHNLKKLTVDIPLKILTCVTGVSGSGKSSLISEILYPALSNHLHNAKLPVGKHKEIIGLDLVDKIIAVDQSPIGRTPRSNAATYIKLFDEIRDLYAQLQEARIRGFTPGHFSFNVKEGTCPYCQGLGTVSIDLDFLESASVTCPQCQGARFDPEILTIRFKGKNIADLLDTDVDEALAIFSEIPPIREKLQMLHEVGLGYLKLGQPSTTLSGGEAQRIKLAKELVRPPSGNTLYLFDEPTTGLHFEDIRRLIAILQKLVDRGNTVLIIEHNLDLIQTADWLIDLGPKAGIYGGELLGSLPPEKMAKLDTPTGRVLRGEKAALSHPLRKKKGSDVISIENGTQNNLKSVSLKIPRGKISLFTGPSGSGKSSLAFDTLYAEGQRRYTETLPPYMRSMIHQLPKPKVDRIDGLAPSIALEQKRGGLNPRSTVGTMTEIYDLLRLLYANLGDPFCPETGEPIQEISKGFVVSKLMSLSQEKIAILSPISLEKKESLEEFTERLNAQGFLRIRLDGTIYALDEKIPFEKGRKQELLLVIDRLILDPKNRERLYEAIDKAAKLSQGIVIIARERQEDLFFNLKFAVEKTGKSYPPITPQTFSFNHEEGMCLECQGLGSIYGFPWMTNPKVMSLSLMDLCIHLFGEKGTTKVLKIFATYWEECGLDLHAPLEQLSPKELDWIFHGAPEQEIKKCVTLKWMGLNPLFASIARMGKKEVKEHLLPLMTTSPCPNCKGARLNPLARHVTLNGTTLPALCAQELDTLLPFFQKLNLEKAPFLQETHAQICKTVELLLSLGLSYLSLDRSAPTLSGGELQRIRLAKQLGTGLTSCLYVLDEPTIGLHPFNNEQLNVALKALASLNNTLLLVEHDPMTIQIADQIFDFGPKAGKEGGRIIAQGTYSEILQNPASLTGNYLSGKKSIPIPKKRRPFHPDLRIEGAKLHTLKNLSLGIPKGAITCLTGISGSGKSTLIRYLLKPAAEKALSQRKPPDAIEYEGATISGLSQFEKVVTIDQSPFGQTSRADVNSFTEIAPLIRAHFTQVPLAKAKGLQGKHFSPNHLRGMCRTCWGLGVRTVDLQFLPPVRVPCEACRGFRLNPISLEVRYKGKHLGEFFSSTIHEALHFFQDVPKIAKRLQLLIEVGLEYLTLGQEIASLSGGELQRLRLSKELAKKENGKTLYLIDEPTVGLHFEDIARLLPIFHRLADRNNTLIIIEHNLDLIANADYIIDLGPDAGPRGGTIVAQGTPEEVAKSKTSRIAPYLKSHLA